MREQLVKRNSGPPSRQVLLSPISGAADEGAVPFLELLAHRAHGSAYTTMSEVPPGALKGTAPRSRPR